LKNLQNSDLILCFKKFCHRQEMEAVGMALDLSGLKKAMGSFEKAVKVVSQDKKMAMLDEDQKDVIRAGIIQNFEFTYELCWKFMKRWLGNSLGGLIVDGITRRELFRYAAEHQLIENVDLWMEYHDARNEIAHTYNEKTAEDVFLIAKKFLYDAREFIKKLEEKND